MTLSPGSRPASPRPWGAIAGSHGAAAPKVVAERLCKSLNSQGTLAVLRQVFELIGVPGLRHAVAMCKFMASAGHERRPAGGAYPDFWVRGIA